MTKFKIFLLSLASVLPISSISYASESKILDLKEYLRELEMKQGLSGESLNPELNRAIEELQRQKNQSSKSKNGNKIYARITSFWKA